MKAEIIITNILSNPDGSKYAFAVHSEDGDGVFVPVNAISFAKFNITEGGTYEAFLTPNKSHSNTPWFCSLLSKPLEQNERSPEPEHTVKSMTQRIEEYINASEVAMSSNEICYYFNISSLHLTESFLSNLYEQKRIAKITFSTGPEEPAAHVAYCSHDLLRTSFLDLIEADEDDDE